MIRVAFEDRMVVEVIIDELSFRRQLSGLTVTKDTIDLYNFTTRREFLQ